MLRIEGLRKSFRDGSDQHEVLRGVDLELAPGEFLALVGRSGSGKSTLLNCVAGLERPDAGTVRLGDTTLGTLGDDALTRLRRDRIGIVFQFFNLLGTLRVLENVALPGLLAQRPRAEVLDRARRLLDELGLGDRAGARPDELSGGEQQRVATARALINSPELLLADEPTGNLDEGTARQTLELLRQVNESHKVMILMVTHSKEAAAIARRSVAIHDGRIDAKMPPPGGPPNRPPVEPPQTPPAPGPQTPPRPPQRPPQEPPTTPPQPPPTTPEPGGASG